MAQTVNQSTIPPLVTDRSMVLAKKPSTNGISNFSPNTFGQPSSLPQGNSGQRLLNSMPANEVSTMPRPLEEKKSQRSQDDRSVDPRDLGLKVLYQPKKEDGTSADAIVE